MKHSKYKNTGMLFELLTRQVTSDVLNNRENSPALRIIKENFKKGSVLKRELVLYNTLMNEKYKKYITKMMNYQSFKINNYILIKKIGEGSFGKKNLNY